MSPLTFVKETFKNFREDDAMTLGGALAFYSALSLAPLLLILLWMASFLGEATQQNLINQIVVLIGAQAGEAIESIVDNAHQRPTLGTIAGTLSIAVLIFSAAGVFAQLQHALNIIWNVEAKPAKGIWRFLRKRLLSAGMVMALGFLLIVSLTLSAVLSAFLDRFAGSVASARLWTTLNLAVPFVVFTFLFALLFKYLPDVKIAWRDVWLGSSVTALLFTVGKSLIGLYLGQAGVGSAYGAAGSFLALLVWVYYSSLILFFGAELTQVWARVHGRDIQPDQHAVYKLRGEPRAAVA